MPKRRKKTKEISYSVGSYSFLLGIFIAIVGGLVPLPNAFKLLLVFLGLIVGFLNITETETIPFLVAAIALSMVGLANFNVIPYVGIYITQIVTNILYFVAPAAIIVALKAIYELASTV